MSSTSWRSAEKNALRANKKVMSRLRRERYTILVMIEVYCRDNHGPRDGLCAECQELHAYAMQRIDKCPFQIDKPTCAKCPIHCYKPEMRARVRAVMRYAGPRMILRHPVLAVLHSMDGLARSSRLRNGKKFYS